MVLFPSQIRTIGEMSAKDTSVYMYLNTLNIHMILVVTCIMRDNYKFAQASVS